MGKIRKLSTGELDTRIKELSKDKEWLDIYKEEAEKTGDSLDRVLRKAVQWDYELAKELRIHKNDLRALQTEDLINYIEKVREMGLLKPYTLLEEIWEWEEPEQFLFENLKVSQIKSLPEKYQLLLGFRNGKRITEEDLWLEFHMEKENTLKGKILLFLATILHAIAVKFSNMYVMMICFFLVVFFFIWVIFTNYGPNSINCANPRGDYQKDVCERAYKRTFREKWGRDPY